MMDDDRFNVVVFDEEGYWRYAERDVGGRRAVILARFFVAAAASNFDAGAEIAKVMITDADDFCNFLWERGKGVVYPPPH